MKMTAGYSFIFAGVVLNALGQLLLKAGTNAVGQFEFVADNIVPVATRIALQPYIVAGVFCYGISLIVWLMGLSRIPVSVAYPLLSLGYVINAVAAWYLFGETPNPARIAGIGLIVAGVFFIAKG
jgi:drug/metabolite transporter (DMT)-like permease